MPDTLELWQRQWDDALENAVVALRPWVLVGIELSSLVPAKGSGEVFVGALFREQAICPEPWMQPRRRVEGGRWPPEGVRIECLFRCDSYDEAIQLAGEQWVVKASRKRGLGAPYVLAGADA